MKHLKLSLLLIFFPLIFFAQQLTGLWMGKLSNDSNTVRKDDEYEIVLTQYKNKVYGYTRNTFFVDDNLYYIVKKVEGEINGDICEVKDAGLIMHNFPQRPEKKVKVSYTFRRNGTDSTWNLEGDWKTNQTKKYYSISGKSDLKTEKDLSKSKIFPHLEELKKTEDLVFYNEWKKETAIAKNDESFKQEFLKSLVSTEKEKNKLKENSSVSPPVINTSSMNIEQVTAVNIKVEEKKTSVTAEKQNAAGKEAIVAGKPVQIQPKEIASVTPKPKPQPAPASKPVSPPPAQPVAKSPAAVISNQTVATKAPVVEKAISREIKKETVTPPPSAVVKTNLPITNTDAAKAVAEREFDKPQEFNFKSDSLVLALFDNGEVDGDTVSVLLNGEVIIAKQCLKTTAFKKTIYIPAGEYQANIVLYAENLGSYPPNTGLLVIYDGEDRFNVRFSADFKKNSAIVLKRNK